MTAAMHRTPPAYAVVPQKDDAPGLDVRLQQWLRRELEGHGGTSISLSHSIGDRASEPIRTWDAEADFQDVVGLARQIQLAAEDDAEGAGGTQRYSVHAWKRGEKMPIGRIRFVVIGTEVEDFDSSSPSEPANYKGIVGQQMRHNEALVKGMLHATTSVQAMMVKMLTAFEVRCGRLEDERIPLLKAFEELTSLQHSRALATEQATADIRMREELYEKAMALMPMLVNKIVGQNVLPMTASADAQSMDTILGSLDEQEVLAIEGLLGQKNPAYSLAFRDLYVSRQAAHRDKQQAKAAQKAKLMEVPLVPKRRLS